VGITYVDESGQDTEGDLFIVGVMVNGIPGVNMLLTFNCLRATVQLDGSRNGLLNQIKARVYERSLLPAPLPFLIIFVLRT
jgi:hypothetical protein